MLYINAVNVHQGGGKTLLLALIEVISNDMLVTLILDERMELDDAVPENVSVRRVRPTIRGRFSSEVWLYKNTNINDKVLCFGNLPPLFRLCAKTIVFMQNRYLIDRVSLSHLTFKIKLRLTLERLWLLFARKNADEFIVQTQSMFAILDKYSKGGTEIHICPYLPKDKASKTNVHSIKNTKFDFIYVATGEGHKNHLRLIDAFVILAKEGVYPSLCLTLDGSKYPLLTKIIEEKVNKYNLNIVNVGFMQKSDLITLYSNAGALLYPSTFESFGLPLIEAAEFNLPIVASELDYVRDIIEPTQTFDPDSPLSIARAVKRFMNLPDKMQQTKSPGEFLEIVTNIDNISDHCYLNS